MRKILLIALCVYVSTASAQNVGINTTGATPNTHSILDVSSSSHGILIPRMTTAQRGTFGGGLGATEEGMAVYDTDTDSFWFWDGSSWGELVADTDNDWTISGNNMYSAVSGNVGIGITNPAFKLEVQVPDGDIAIRTRGTAGNARFVVRTDGNANVLLYTSNGVDLRMGVGNSPDDIVINSSGFVGIGTTTPGAPLQISRNSSNYTFDVDGAGGGYTTTFDMDGTGLDIGHNSSARNLNLKTNSLDRLTVTGAGAVGIGTTTPAGLFTVFDNVSNSRFYFDVDAAAGSYSTIFDMDVTGLDIGHNSSIRNLNLKTNSADRLTITASGDVGIGTTAPAHLLDVAGTGVAGHFDRDFATDATTSRDAMWITRSYSGGVGAAGLGTRFRFNGETTTEGSDEFMGNVGFTWEDATAGTPDSYFSVHNALNGVSQEVMRITSAGNVGIGTTTPARTLHVNDVMRLQPRATAPSSPGAGDMYFDSITNKLTVYDGTAWQACW
jgi:hypothetical protein